MNRYDKNTILVVMQATSFCNIDCKYCYLPDRNIKGKMSDTILEEAIKKVLKSHMIADEVMFLWHSGEPLSAGIPFYKKAIELINKHNINNKKVINAIQTNATLINQEWCDFFRAHDFRIGISLDGPEFLHDNNRIYRNGKGTFKNIMHAVSLLKENKIPLAAICVISKKTLDYPNELFDFYLENGFSGLSLVLEEIIGENTQSSINDSLPDEIKKKYINFMAALFKNWIKAKDKIHVREFGELSSLIVKNIKSPGYEPRPQEVIPLKIITIQKNGDISSFCPELAGGIDNNSSMFSMGNIMNFLSLEDILENDNFIKISKSIKLGVENCRKSCSYFNLCGGKSPSTKMYEKKSFEITSTKHCLLHRQTLADVIINELAIVSQQTSNMLVEHH